MPKQLQTRQVIVTLAPASPGHWASITAALAQTYDLPQTGGFPLQSLGVQCVVFRIPHGRSVEDTLRRLAADPRVESVQLNQVFQGLGDAHNDPYATLQHGAHDIGADVAHRWATGKGVTVAVVDTGVEREHPDLHESVVRAVNFVEDGAQTFTQDRHGTAVAGVIAARADNAIGIFGIAPEADIIAVKACWHPALAARAARCSSWSLAKAIDFTILLGVRVLNLSLAGPSDPLLARLIAKAVEQDMTVVAAVLEEDQTLGFPASLESVIAVRTDDRQGQNRMAGGKHSTPLRAPGSEILTTVPPYTYDFLSGSSLAAAHVSGIAALLLERQPTLSPAQIEAILRTTSQPVQNAGNPTPAALGLVNACNALGQLLDLPACP